jgi:uncharacterized delta-60 repeat protein
MKHTNRFSSIFSGKTKKAVIAASVLMFIFIFTRSASSQVEQQWVKNYSYQSYRSDILNDMAIDNSGNVYVTGESNSITTEYDYATVKYNLNGTQQWAMRYDGPPHNEPDRSYAVAVDNSGNSYITGTTGNTAITGQDITTIKYNSAGVEIWIKVYSTQGAAIDKGNDITVDNLGNVYVVGTVKNAGNDIVTIKYNSAGAQQWATVYNSSGSNGDNGSSITVDASGNVYVAGTAYGDAVLIKYNSAGTQQWAKTYNGPGGGSDNFWLITMDASGNIYTAGESASGPTYDYALVKFNSSGTQLWAKNYAGPGAGDDMIKGLKVDASGNVYITGESKGTTSDKDYATIKYNSAGTEQWVARYNGPDNLADLGYGVTVDADGNVYVTGKSKGTATNDDFATIKYNSAGVQQWVMRYDGPNHSVDYGKLIQIDNSGNIVVAGVGRIDAADDYCTIKYAPLTGIQINNGEIPKDFSLSQNYPNPFNPTTNISFTVPNAGNVKIAVYDMLGREVSVLVNENLNAGSYTYDFNASGLSSGTYFYKMTAGNFSDIKKLVVVK